MYKYIYTYILPSAIWQMARANLRGKHSWKSALYWMYMNFVADRLLRVSTRMKQIERANLKRQTFFKIVFTVIWHCKLSNEHLHCKLSNFVNFHQSKAGVPMDSAKGKHSQKSARYEIYHVVEIWRWPVVKISKVRFWRKAKFLKSQLATKFTI